MGYHMALEPVYVSELLSAHFTLLNQEKIITLI
jgi:predicted metallopeptidase